MKAIPLLRRLSLPRSTMMIPMRLEVRIGLPIGFLSQPSPDFIISRDVSSRCCCYTRSKKTQNILIRPVATTSLRGLSSQRIITTTKFPRSVFHPRCLSATTNNRNQNTVGQEENLLSPDSGIVGTSSLDTNPPLKASSERLVKPMERYRLYRYLELQTFTKDEVEATFDRIQKIKTSNYNYDVTRVTEAGNGVNEENLTIYLNQRIQEIEDEENIQVVD